MLATLSLHAAIEVMKVHLDCRQKRSATAKSVVYASDRQRHATSGASPKKVPRPQTLRRYEQAARHTKRPAVEDQAKNVAGDTAP